MPSSVTARVSSVTDAAGSFSGSVASDEKRGERSRTILANASFTSRAKRTARSGGSTCVPGVVNVMHLRVDAFLLEHALAIRDVAMSAHGDVVVAGIVQARIALGVDRQLDGAVAGLERVEVLGRIEVVVNVNQHVVAVGEWRVCEAR